jgi:arsenate reductase (thioredoxin)
MTERVYNVLFIDQANSVRSIFAESILRQAGGGRFAVCSAGCEPRGEIHPRTLSVLQAYDLPTNGLYSKGWEEFAGPIAPEMDFIFTVCDYAGSLDHPRWPGHPICAHWGVDDPTLVEGAEMLKESAFVSTFRQLRNRILAFAALPLDGLDRLTIQARLRAIGHAPEALRLSPKPA